MASQNSLRSPRVTKFSSDLEQTYHWSLNKKRSAVANEDERKRRKNGRMLLTDDEEAIDLLLFGRLQSEPRWGKGICLLKCNNEQQRNYISSHSVGILFALYRFNLDFTHISTRKVSWTCSA